TAMSCEIMHHHRDDTTGITLTTTGPSEPPASLLILQHLADAASAKMLQSKYHNEQM
ncbi:Protein Bet, partial [Dissostichus eleginoides]